MVMRRTRGESLFEEYLNTRGIDFHYEPTDLGRKKPDYLLKTNPPILVEIEDFAGNTSLERSVQKQLIDNGGEVIWDQSLAQIFGRIRAVVKRGYDQLKEHGANYHTIVILYKPPVNVTDETNIRYIVRALYGDTYTRWDKPTEEPQEILNTKTGLFGPKRRKEISAVAVLEKALSGKIIMNLVHNRFAINKLPINLLECDEEIIFDEKSNRFESLQDNT